MGKRVDPIRNPEDIDRIKSELEDSPRNLALFTVGINVALRAIDLLSITLGQVRCLLPGEYFFLTERKTGKRRSVVINEASHAAITRLLTSRTTAREDHHALFASRKGRGQPIRPDRLNRLVQEWCRGMQGDFGSHSLRKTWGYHQRVRFRTDTPTLMRAFNHSSEAQTLTYLGVTARDVHAAFMHEI